MSRRPGTAGARRRSISSRSIEKTRRAKLGQHFLSDMRYRSRIADALGLRPGELVIEIGPGHGAVTPLLAERAGKVLGIELDGKLADELRHAFEGDSRIEIIQADILGSDLSALCREHDAVQCFLFGNLPYYITSPILHHVLEFAGIIRAMAFVMQREVAERIVAQPGSRDYGYLSVFVQYHAKPRVAFHIPAGAFSPRPKVESSLVLFEMRPDAADEPETRREEFLKFVKRCFAQKRKKLVNNLAPFVSRRASDSALAALSISPAARAEDLSVAQFRALFERL